MSPSFSLFFSLLFFFFNDTATTEIYTLSLHDALPIYQGAGDGEPRPERPREMELRADRRHLGPGIEHVCHAVPRERSEEHTSELQSPCNLVCRLLLEKKKKKKIEVLSHDDVAERAHPT